MKKYIITIVLLLTTAAWSLNDGFNFNECSGSDYFEQQIKYYNHDYENAITVGTIPAGIEGLSIELVSNKDVDIRLYGNNDDKIVHWPHGLLSQSTEKSTKYKKTEVTYSGYNGVDGKKGHESIVVSGTTQVPMTMKAFGYQAGLATVNYSWTGKKGCTDSDREGNFTQSIAHDTLTLVGDIPAGIPNVSIKLTSGNDLDIQLYGKDGTVIVGWKPKGLLSDSKVGTVAYKGMNITWSGYNGTNENKGNEYIKITGNTTEALTMKVYGYEAGFADVKYSWGKDNNVTACTKEYVPVCGITNPCPPGAACLLAPIYKTFSNMCMLDVANAEFAYTGECTKSYETSITIKSKKVECTGFMAPGTQCLKVQEEGSKVWDIVYGIKGLSYEEGYKYKVLAKVTKSDPNMMDAPSKFYTLIKILKKDLVDDNNGTVCTQEYAPVCGLDPLVDCPEDNQTCNQKTYGNMCMLNVANAEFAYNGECTKSYETSITIKSKKVECTGFIAPGTQCLKVQEEGSKVWDIVYGIKGLSYEEGYKYKVLAKVTKSDPNMMDAPSKFYTLIKILKKDLVDDNITACTEEYAPVCGLDPDIQFIGDIADCKKTNTCLSKTFPNICTLKNAKSQFLYEGKCKTDPVEEKEILYVGPTQFACIALDGFKCPTYEVKYNEIDEWKKVFYSIKGFKHKSNYQYKLSVKKIVEIDDLLVPGDTSVKYKLLKVLEKTLVVPESCIAWFDGCNSCAKIKNDNNSTYSSIGVCTEMYCELYEDFKCTAYNWQ